MDVQLPDGTMLRGVPDGTSKADLIVKLKANGYDTSKLEPTSVNVGNAVNSIPRQLGLAARYGIEGLADSAQVFTEPIRYLTDKLTPDRQRSLSDVVKGNAAPPKSMPLGVVASQFADYLGLPKPQGADERVIGDATKLVAGAGGLAGATRRVGGIASDLLQFGGEGAAPVTQGIEKALSQNALTGASRFLSENPVQQLASAAGAGYLGGSAREAGGDGLKQTTAAVIGGVLGGKAPDIANTGVSLAKTLFNKGMTTQQFDVKIANVLKAAGVDYNEVPEKVRQSLREELKGALQADKELNPEAVARFLDFKTTGITPTRGMVTLDPVQITREQNLAKMGANSGDGVLQGLAKVQNQNNAKLITNLNALGADRGNTLKAGETVTSSILGTQAGLRNAEQAAWDAAKGSPGYKQPISAGVLGDINAALDAEGMMPFMNPQISRYIEAFQNGAPFTPQAYRNLQSMLSRETMKGGNEGAAAGLAARILRESDLKPAGFANGNNSLVTQGMAAGMRNADAASAEAIDAVNQARQATRRAYAYEESSPLVKSVLSEGRSSDPQRIAQSYIIGGTAREAEDLVRQLGPNGIEPIKQAILSHLKDRALNGAADEVGKFSQSAFNKALSAIGDRKLDLLFTKEEIAALRANGRVASYMQVQPVGSAVNNSNSGAMLLGRGYDALKGLAGKLPGGKSFVLDPLQNIELSIGNFGAKRVLPSLLAEQEKMPIGQNLMLPSLGIGGLLSP